MKGEKDVKNFVTSDTHFGHKKIIEYARPEYRNGTIEDMDNDLILRWNKTVSPEDTVYHLGDFAWKENQIKKITEKLNGKIILILGNHDPSRVAKNPGKYGFEAVYKFGLDLKKVSLSHYPMLAHRRLLQFHGHDHEVDKTLKIHKRDHGNRCYVNLNCCVENWYFTPINMDLLVVHLSEISGDFSQFKDLNSLLFEELVSK